MFYLDLLFNLFFLAALGHECLVTSWPENSNDTSHVNVKTNVPGPLLAEDCDKTSSQCAASLTFELCTGKSNLHRVIKPQHAG